MTALLDTNVLVRHFTGSPLDQGDRATAFLRTAAPRELILVDLVAAEFVFVLQSVYRQPRRIIARLLRAVLALPAVRCDHAGLLHQTIEFYEAGHNFTDAYLIAMAEQDGIPSIARMIALARSIS